MAQKKSDKSKKGFFATLGGTIILLIIYLLKPDLLNSNSQGLKLDNFHIRQVQDGLPDMSNYDYQLLKHDYLTIFYSPKYKDPWAVCYILTKKMLSGKQYSRDNDEFVKDPLLDENYSLSSDYRGSGYDRGHMCPSADMAFSEESQAQTFYMSNITPQKPKFNRGIWKELEEQVREWAKENDSLYIVVGAVYSKRPKRLGLDRVAVPSYFYKVVADISEKDGYKAIAFYMKNYEYPDSTNFMNFAISVDSLESLTNIKFFSQFSDSVTYELKNSLDKSLWK